MSSLEHEATRTEGAQAEELLGIVFTTPKDLRHAAEQVLGQEFVPTEVVCEDETTADLVLPRGCRRSTSTASASATGIPTRSPAWTTWSARRRARSPRDR